MFKVTATTASGKTIERTTPHSHEAKSLADQLRIGGLEPQVWMVDRRKINGQMREFPVLVTWSDDLDIWVVVLKQ